LLGKRFVVDEEGVLDVLARQATVLGRTARFA
jgi:hypothetical protein